MNERTAFLRAICENPDDDTPRLVFADWLQEHGDEERAEFIRVQVRFGELLREGTPDAGGFGRQAQILWRSHGRQWRAELPIVSGLTWHDAFYRGFVERVTIASDTELVRHAAVIFGQPIRHLVVAFRGVPGFAQLRGLTRLKTLTLVNQHPTATCITELLKCDGLDESVMLSCYFGHRGDSFAKELVAAFGTRLHRLNEYSLPR